MAGNAINWIKGTQGPLKSYAVYIPKNKQSTFGGRANIQATLNSATLASGGNNIVLQGILQFSAPPTGASKGNSLATQTTGNVTNKFGRTSAQPVTAQGGLQVNSTQYGYAVSHAATGKALLYAPDPVTATTMMNQLNAGKNAALWKSGNDPVSQPTAAQYALLSQVQQAGSAALPGRVTMNKAISAANAQTSPANPTPTPTGATGATVGASFQVLGPTGAVQTTGTVAAIQNGLPIVRTPNGLHAVTSPAGTLQSVHATLGAAQLAAVSNPLAQSVASAQRAGLVQPTQSPTVATAQPNQPSQPAPTSTPPLTVATPSTPRILGRSAAVQYRGGILNGTVTHSVAQYSVVQTPQGVHVVDGGGNVISTHATLRSGAVAMGKLAKANAPAGTFPNTRSSGTATISNLAPPTRANLGTPLANPSLTKNSDTEVVMSDASGATRRFTDPGGAGNTGPNQSQIAGQTMTNAYSAWAKANPRGSVGYQTLDTIYQNTPYRAINGYLRNQGAGMSKPQLANYLHNDPEVTLNGSIFRAGSVMHSAMAGRGYTAKRSDYTPAGVDKWVKTIDSTLSSHPLQRDTVMWRGASTHTASGSPNEYTKLIKSLKPGDTFKDHAYTSVSVDKAWARDVYATKHGGPGVLVKVLAPSGTKGAYLPAKGGKTAESEYLLGRGARFRLLDKTVDPRTGITHATIELIDQD